MTGIINIKVYIKNQYAVISLFIENSEATRGDNYR